MGKEEGRLRAALFVPTMIRMRRLLLLAALPLLAACGGGGPAAAGKGTLFGTVSRGPGGACPSQEEPCAIPASGMTLSFSRGGSPSVSTTTGANGHYRVRLPAGRYAVEGPQLLKPRHVEVEAGESRRVDFAADSKIS